tara:strand:+ start:60865 stop:65322 length:4458 start_codon:yes stop_codon:yes gene_type:complete
MEFITSKKSIIILIISVFFNISSYSQNTLSSENFSSDYTVFLTELKEVLNVTTNANAKKIYKKFLKNQDYYSINDRKKITEILSYMLNKSYKINIYFYKFFEVLSVFSSDINNPKLFEDWLNVCSIVVEDNSKKNILKFFDFTIHFLKTKSLYESKLTKWEVDSDSFGFTNYSSQPVVTFFSKLNLKCINSKGKIEISSTKGNYYPLLNRWIGTDGVVYWGDHFAKDSVFALTPKYKINTKESKIELDSALFYNKFLNLEGVEGYLKNIIVSGNQLDKYPQFVSYSKNIKVENLFKNIDYEGGYKLNGKEFVADGGDEGKARIKFRRNNNDVFVINANRFSISNDKISSKSAGVTIFFDNDSLFSSNLEFKYFNNNKKVMLFRNNRKSLSPPMIDTYHDLTIDFELLEWSTDSTILTFGSLPGTSESNIRFESTDMYLQSRYDLVQGVDKFHPLILISDYVKSINKNRFYVSDLARYSGIPLLQMRTYLGTLSSYGFIFYDFSDESIMVQPMLQNYINANYGLDDYDVISFNSKRFDVNKNNKIVNAVLDLNTRDLMISGVPEIKLSNARNVYIYPTSKLITVKKNRDFLFDGQIIAGSGRINLFGKKFLFDYNNFKLDLKYIDSVQISVPVEPLVLDMYGNPKLTNTKTLFEYVYDNDSLSDGLLEIDYPENKSGLFKDSFPEFPKFTSFQKSFAYYDTQNSKFAEAYTRDNFYFHLDSYTIDSVDSYLGRELSFAGKFHSADIFPVFKDTLRLQDDFSFGFKTSTPDTGYYIYKNKSKFTNDIFLSNDGLKGKGNFEYLTLFANAEKIMFFPDSMILQTNIFKIQEVSSGIEFPNVSNNNTLIEYYPYDDELYAKIQEQEFNMYNNSAKLFGSLLMRPTGLIGDGKMKLDKAELVSENFSYNANWFASESADLVVYDNKIGNALSANNLRSYIDLKNRQGEFNSNGSDSYVNLISNNYICYIDKLNWDMDQESLSLTSNIKSSKNGSTFVSTHPDQDSIFFNAQQANYSLKDYILNAQGVDSIEVADAVIFPDSGKIVLNPNAIISTLENSTVIADNIYRYHKFTNASIDILSANFYSGSGFYTFIDSENNMKQMFFNNIKVNTDSVTEARGRFTAGNIFKLNHKFDFKGEVDLFANNENLTFDGFFNIKHKCNTEKEWVKFRSEIDPNSVQINLDEKIFNENGDELISGILLREDTLEFYSCFLSKKQSSFDKEVLLANSSIFYDDISSSFIINSNDSLNNTFEISDVSCKTYGHGNINLHLNLGRVNSRIIGSIEHDMINKDLIINGFMMLDFHFSEAALQEMAIDIGNIGYDSYSTLFAKNVKKIIKDPSISENFIIDPTDFKPSTFPKEMSSSLAFTDIQLNWQPTTNSFINNNDIGLGNILSFSVNEYLKGNIILQKGWREDVIIIRLITPAGEDYCFKYERGDMWVFSHNLNFMSEINKESDSKRKINGRPQYSYSFKNEDWMTKIDKEIRKKYSVR